MEKKSGTYYAAAEKLLNNPEIAEKARITCEKKINKAKAQLNASQGADMQKALGDMQTFCQIPDTKEFLEIVIKAKHSLTQAYPQIPKGFFKFCKALYTNHEEIYHKKVPNHLFYTQYHQHIQQLDTYLSFLRTVKTHS